MHLGCRGSFPIGKGAKIAKAMPAIRKLIAKSGEIKRAFQYSWVKATLDDALIPAACRISGVAATGTITCSSAIYRTPAGTQHTYITAASKCPIPSTVKKSTDATPSTPVLQAINGATVTPPKCRINPRQDNVSGGRTFFTAMTDQDEYALAHGEHVGWGPETWSFEFEEPFFLSDSSGKNCIEIVISSGKGGKYAIRFRPGQLAQASGGAW